MDISTSCNSTSTSAPVKLDLRLLDRCSLSALTRIAYELLTRGSGRIRLHTSLWLRALIRSWEACMYANSGARECAFNLRFLIQGSTAQKCTTLLRKNTFSGVH